MRNLFTLLALLVITTCHAQYLPADSSFYRSSPPVSELELRVRRIELNTQAFEKQARIGKHIILVGLFSMTAGTLMISKHPLHGLGYLFTLTGVVGATCGNIIILDAPRVLRADKVRRRREL
ncbi:MAG: hypothetical protein ACK478_03285 [Flavobacteriales bacterium]|jgi:hypothetical protein